MLAACGFPEPAAPLSRDRRLRADTANPIALPARRWPAGLQKLSELGVFQEPLAALQPAAGVVAYDVNVSLYSDGAQKHRFVYVPPGQRIETTADRWMAPSGTYFIKNFYFPNDARDPSQGIRLIETRFLVKQATGFEVSTYLWNDAQTDALVPGGNVDVPTHWVDQNGDLHDDYFHVPGTSLCQTCHQDRALGWRTRQLDHPGSYADGTTDQIGHLIAAGIADAQPQPGTVLIDTFGDGGLDARARSYLDVNCANCHAVGGEAYGTGVLWDYEDTGPGALPLCKRVESVAGRHLVIVPGAPSVVGVPGSACTRPRSPSCACPRARPTIPTCCRHCRSFRVGRGDDSRRVSAVTAMRCFVLASALGGAAMMAQADEIEGRRWGLGVQLSPYDLTEAGAPRGAAGGQRGWLPPRAGDTRPLSAR